ncbi:PQQ-binding-like beta-propeller repeat protein [Polymorphospora sp. NPDC051019]|uniref:outer membrane protein assembly factor BamB family protein n=1 Tax=Polymorphospora sp. NPDC051019 TaxID=3155725 RepID=UPI00342902AF
MSTVIDLGVPALDGERPAPARRPAAHHRRTVLAGLTALLLLVTGGAEPPAEPALVEVAVVPTSPMHNHTLAGDRLYSAELDPRRGGRVVTAYELGDGAARWTNVVEPPAGADSLGLDIELAVWPTGEQLLVSSHDGTSGLDPATGEVRWSTRPGILDHGGHGVGLSLAPPTDPAVAPGDGRGQVLRGVDLVTGAELWTSGPIGSGRFLTGATGALLVVETVDQGVEVRDPRTGTVRAALGAEPGRWRSVAGNVDDLLIVVFLGEVTGHAADTLDTRWSFTSPSGRGVTTACGPHVCVRGDGRLTLLDAADGTVLGGIPRTGSPHYRAGHLLIRDGAGDGGTMRSLAPDGRTLIEMPGWVELAESPATAPAVLIRRDGDGHRSSFALLEPGATALRFLGTVPYPVHDCRSTPTHIVCQVGPDRLRVWRYR